MSESTNSIPHFPIRSSRDKTRRFPQGAAKRRDLLFKEAGINLQDEAALLKEAFDTNRALLSAEKLEVRVLDDGTVVTVPVPDNQVRQRAVESVFDVVGAKQNTRGESGGDGPKLTLVLPNYYSPEFLEREQKVIDVTGAVEPPTTDGAGCTSGIQCLEEDVSDVESVGVCNVDIQYAEQPTGEGSSADVEPGTDGVSGWSHPNESIHGEP